MVPPLLLFIVFVVLYRDMSAVMPRRVTFVVSDEVGFASNPATVILNFKLIDNPPVLDLNGDRRPGNDFTTEFREGSNEAIEVTFGH